MDAILGRTAAAMPTETAQSERISGLMRAHFALVWRYLRRLGLTEADADDAAQQVFMTVLRKLDAIDNGKERAFLLSVSLRVAADARKARRRRRTDPDANPDDVVDPAPNPEAALERRRACDLFDQMLEALDEEARAVFVLYEVEHLTMREIAEVLSTRPGTVASRLRRARKEFQATVERYRARQHPGEPNG
jgi:RNA polymerase sigma-70 factor (ECF subfamily)